MSLIDIAMSSTDNSLLLAFAATSLEDSPISQTHIAIAHALGDLLLAIVLKTGFRKQDMEILRSDADLIVVDAATDVARSDPRMSDIMLKHMPHYSTLSRLIMIDNATRRIEELVSRDDVDGAIYVFHRVVTRAYLAIVWGGGEMPPVDWTRFSTNLFDESESLLFGAVRRNVAALHRLAESPGSGARLVEFLFGRFPRLMARLDAIAECVVGGPIRPLSSGRRI